MKRRFRSGPPKAMQVGFGGLSISTTEQAAQETERLARGSPHPVIAAGSTGTIPATARLLKAIAELSDGTEVDVTGVASWSTNNLFVGVVAEAGLLTGLSVGDCEVVVLHAGITAKLNVKVTLLE